VDLLPKGIFSLSLLHMNNTIYEFTIWMEDRINYAMKTIDTYERYLYCFDRYLQKNFCFWIEESDKITIKHVDNFMQYLKSTWIITRTSNNYLASIKLFLKYRKIEWLQVVDPTSLVYGKEEQAKMCFLETSEVDLFIQEIQKNKNPLTKIRDRLMVRLIYTTGLRVQEMIDIKVSDIWESDELQVIWKGRKLRLVFVCQEVKDLVKYYLRLRESRGIKGEYLFVSHSHNNFWEKLDRSHASAMMREYRIKIWLDKKATPHTLRHSFATHLLRKNVNIYDIKQLLWHSSILTTQKYLHSTNTDLRNAQSKIW